MKYLRSTTLYYRDKRLENQSLRQKLNSFVCSEGYGSVGQFIKKTLLDYNKILLDYHKILLDYHKILLDYHKNLLD